MVLPRFLVLGSMSNRYVSLMKDAPAGVPAGLLKSDGEQVVSPQAKFEVEMAKTGNGLVHIRCCYNNRYWVANQFVGDDIVWIVASAGKREEDESKTSCTLFEPIFEGEKQVRFRHVGLHRFASLWKSDTTGPFLNALYLGASEVFKVVDWEALVILPSRVAFKSEETGNYLRSVLEWPYQRFESNLNVANPLVAKELFVTGEGNLRIKDGHYAKFWRRSPNWIWADAAENSYTNDTLFWPVRVGDNVIALRNLGNDNFCGRLTTEGKINCLNAHFPAITETTRLVVEELVLSRDIYDFNYRLSDSRIYEEKIIEMDTVVAVNHSPDSDSTTTLKFSRKDAKIRSWIGSVSLKLGVKTTIQVSAVPLIVDGKIELSAEATTGYQWGETTTIENTREASYTVVVPRLSKIKVSLVASQASCDVPYSYTQRDVLTDGQIKLKTMNDGIFKGTNAYKFNYQSTVEKMTRSDLAIDRSITFI